MRGRHPRRRAWMALGIAIATVMSACSSGDDSAPATTAPTSTAPSTPVPGQGTGAGPTSPIASFQGVRLTRGTAGSDPVAPAAVVAGTPLDQAAIDAVTARLPEWTADAATAPFNWPAQTLQPPQTGTVVDLPFPSTDPAPTEETVPTGPLQVVRHQPEGAVDVAPFVSVTFDQPMVPVGTVGQVAAEAAPATLVPDVPGAWQWIGTTTIRFDAAVDGLDRLPMATDYTVTVPAGTVSATGGVLAEDVAWTFSTPPPQVVAFQPDDDESLPLAPVYLAVFDQRIDPSAVLAAVHLSADGAPRGVRPATSAEIADDRAVQQSVDSLPEGRWLAFRPVDPLPADAAIDVDIGPDVPSAEGPITTTVTDSFHGRTYAPLRVEAVECAWGNSCEPQGGITITTNNAIDPDRFDPASIVVDPPIAGASIGVYGDTISISGPMVPEQTYAVTVPAGLTDVFAQQLRTDDTHTVTAGPARPFVRPLQQPLTTVDPSGDPPSVSVVSSGHDALRVTVYAATIEDWPNRQDDPLYEQLYGYGGAEDTTPDLPVLLDTTLEVAGDGKVPVETAIDLSAYLPGGHGHVVLRIAPTDELDQDDPDYWSNHPTLTWVQATDIGLDAFSDARDLHAWTTDLSTGEPVAGAVVRMLGSGPEATTDGDGAAVIDVASNVPATLTATLGDDTAILPDFWRYRDESDVPLWHVLDDRGVYRPGETASVKGWVRRLTADDAQLTLWNGRHDVRYFARDPLGNVLAEGSTTLDASGGFDLTFDLPAGSSTGTGVLFLALDDDPVSGASHTHTFQIAEFRRPDFEVAARTASVGPYVRSTPLTLAVDASYYAGGPLASAPVTWQVTTSSASYSPPGWDDFSFGRWTPWWYADDAYRVPCCDVPGAETEVATYAGTTDGSGAQYVDVAVGDLGEDAAELPVTVRAQATVIDVNRQPITATTDVLVHPADLYAGLRSPRTFVRKGEPLDVDVVVTDIDGAAVGGREVTVTAGRQQSTFRNGQWIEEVVDQQACDVTSADDPVSCSFAPDLGGSYRIEAVVIDGQGRSSRSELTRWVSAAESIPTRTVQQEELTIVPDVEEHRPGATAELLVQAPFATGTGLMVVTHGGIRSTTRFDVIDGSAIVQLAVEETDVPSLDVTIEVVGSAPRTAVDGTELPGVPTRPAFAVGQITLPVSTASRTLDIAVAPRSAQLAPGQSTTVDVSVKDPSGAPVVGSDLAVLVVDEAVLALSGYQLGDPLDTFYGSLPSELAAAYGRGSIVLVDPAAWASTSGGVPGEASTTTTAGGGRDGAEAAMPASVPLADSGLSGGGDSSAATQPGTTTPIDVRSDFDALAVWAPVVTTGADGTAAIDVPLPDSLTRYRVMVVAADGAQRFGTAESTITARLPLMVRPSAPRFLNVGDAFELPVVVQNQSDVAVDADVVVEAANLDPAAATGARVSVPANDRVEVRFPLSAALAGTGRIRVSAVAGEAGDSATVELPVYTPATSETFATYGVVDDGAVVQPVLAPTDVLAQYGGLDVSTSSTSLQALTDAVLYLADYPYESSDALASRILAIVALRDVLDAFDAPGLPSAEALDATVASDVDALSSMQNDDGGFPFWRRGDRSEPYNSVQATHALVAARDAGYPAALDDIDLALWYLTEIEKRIPGEYGPEARDTIEAYALHVRALAGQPDPAKAAALYDSRGEDLGLDALAWLWPIVDDPADRDEIATTIANSAVDTAGAVTFTSEVTDGAYVTLASERRTDALVMDAVITVQPDSDLIPKAVVGLLASQRQGRWDNVQENSFVLLALKHYFDVFESADPDFVARIWLGDQFAGEQAYRDRSTDRNLITIPTEQLQTIGDADLTIAKDGTGRLYYRVGMRTAPASLELAPVDRGFVVARTYEAVDDPADVTRDADGTWRIVAGARVRVRLTMVAESQRTHVALVDPLPAGLEILNPTLETTADEPLDPASSRSVIGAGSWWPWFPTWFDHQNQRDDRAEAFATYLGAGTYDYSYVATATTPGSFVVPPTRAEEIYSPETFGRAATDRVVIA